MFLNISSSQTRTISQSLISCGKIGMVNTQYGLHSYPSAGNTKSFQTGGRIQGSTTEINGITAIHINCGNLHLLFKAHNFLLQKCPAWSYQRGLLSCPQQSRLMVLGGSGIYCFVDTFAEVDNRVSVQKFLIRRNVMFWLASNGYACTLDICSACIM